MDAPRILMLVFATETGWLYTALEGFWARYMNSSPSIHCYFIKSGDQEEPFLQDNTLYIKTQGNDLYLKTLSAFRYFRPELAKYDFVYRTSLSSFIVFDKYLEFCTTLPKSNLCAGGIGEYYNIRYPANRGFTLSIDLVERLIDDPPPHYIMDDVTIGTALNKWGIPIRPADRCDITDNNSGELDDIFHYYIKSPDPAQELSVHKRLYEHFYTQTPRVLMLIIANDDGGLYTTLQGFWARYMNSSPNIDCYFIKGRLDQEAEFVLEENNLYIKTYEGYTENDALYIKTISAFRYFRPEFAKYDFVYRTNLSSFIRFDKYLEFCKTLPRTNLCSAKIGVRDGIAFPSGAGYTLSLDLAERLIDEPVEHYVTDDVTIGVAMTKWGIEIQSAPIFDMVNEFTIDDCRKHLTCVNEKIFHYRIRTYDHGRLDREKVIHQLLHDRFPPKPSKTTIVTMFFDLSTLADATPSVRDSSFYMRHARGVLQVPAPMIVFCDCKYRPMIEELRRSLTDSPTVYIEKNIDEYEFYTMNIGQIRRNRTSSNPRATASYFITTMFKILALKIAKDRADFGTSHYAWIDFGCRYVLKGPMLKPAIQMCLKPNRRVSATYIHYRDHAQLADMPSFVKDGPCGIAAGAFSVEGAYMDAFYSAMMCIFHEMLYKKCGHTEETILTYCYDRYPELFTLNYADYYSLLTNYKGPTTDFQAIRQHFIGNALKAGRADLAAAAAKKILESVDARQILLADHEVAELRSL